MPDTHCVIPSPINIWWICVYFLLLLCLFQASEAEILQALIRWGECQLNNRTSSTKGNTFYLEHFLFSNLRCWISEMFNLTEQHLPLFTTLPLLSKLGKEPNSKLFHKKSHQCWSSNWKLDFFKLKVQSFVYYQWR